MNTSKNILKELNERKSIRAFLEKEIVKEKVDLLFEAARWAPSLSNKQDWHYYAATGEARTKFAEILLPGNHWALKAPLLVVVAYDASMKNIVEDKDYGLYDSGLSAMSLVIEAEHQGLRTHQMAGFVGAKAKEILHMKEGELPIAVMAIGYEADVITLPPDIQEKESRPRTRKAMEEVVTYIQ